MNTRKNRILLIILSIFLFFLVCIWQRPALFLLAGVQIFQSVRSELQSPDGMYVAMVVYYSGGMTTSNETWVNIREGRGWFGIGTLRFGIGEDHWIFAADHTFLENLEWQDQRTLLVEYSANDRLFISKQEDFWQDVHIVYRRIQ